MDVRPGAGEALPGNDEDDLIITNIVRPQTYTSCSTPKPGTTGTIAEKPPTTPSAAPKSDTPPSSNKRKRSTLAPQAAKKAPKKVRTTPTPKMSDKKKTTATTPAAQGNTDPFERMQAFMETQFGITNGNITAISNSVSALNEKCNANTEKLSELQQATERNKKDLSGLYSVIGEKDQRRQEEIVELQRAVEKLKKPEPNDQDQDRPATWSQVAAGARPYERKTPEKESRFWTARRSIRCWPVPGKTASEIKESVIDFLNEKLRIPAGVVVGSDIEVIRRVTSGRFSKITDEVLIVFCSISIRDTVTSYARNLGEWIDEKNNPTAGLRLEIPDHLSGIHKDLKIYGGILRKEHGDGLKRSIKFDDASLTLCMDVKLPGCDEWIRVPHDLAKEERITKERSNTADTRRRLLSSTSSIEMSVDSPRPTNVTANDQTSLPEKGTQLPRSSTLLKHSRLRPGWGSSTK